MAEQSTASRGNTPPYVSYPSFKTLMSDLHEHDVPTRIDRSVLGRFSGIVGSQLLTTLRFLRLIDDKSHPTPRLTELVAAYGTPEWGAKMIAILQDEYAPLFGLDLGNATALHFNETFRKAFPGKDSVSLKSIAFFLGAAKDSGIIVSDRVLHGRKPRTAAATGTSKPRRQQNANGSGRSSAATPKKNGVTGARDGAGLKLHPLLMELLRKIPTEGKWPKDERLRWFKIFAMSATAIYDDLSDPTDLKIELGKIPMDSGRGG
jgi:hypothetical protein